MTLDDATSAILSAFLVEEEGPDSTFRALAEVFGRHGLPLSLYTDRGQPLFSPARGGREGRPVAPDAGGPRPRPSRRRAYRGLFARQARGRSERAFHTLQDRLTKELALAGIATIEAANAFIRDVYTPAHTARFAVKAEQDGVAFVAIKGVDLSEILCVQEDRCVGNDNCVTFNRLKLQIPESPPRAHFVKAKVEVRQYQDGPHAVFHGQRCLGRYDDKGAFRHEKMVA